MKALTPQKILRLQQQFATAQNAHQSGNLSQAEVLYREVLQAAPQALEARNALAIVLASSKRFEEAAKHFRLILKGQPDHAHTHHNLASVLFEQELFDDAIKHYQFALKLDSKLAMAHTNLGIALCKKGRYEAAIESFRNALNLNKTDVAALNAMGLAYRELNDLPRALECLEYATGLAPKNAEYIFNFGFTLAKAELDFEACEQFYKAAEIDPTMMGAFVGLGDVLQKTHRYDEALECFERVKQLQPDAAPTYDRIGQVYLAMSDTENALANFNASLKIEPEHLPALQGIGQAYQDTGKLAEANEIAEKIIGQNSKAVAGYLLRSRVAKIKAGDALPSQLLELLEQPALTPEGSTAIHFALGKVYDDCAQYELAFKHYATGNQIKNESQHYSPEQNEDYYGQIIQTFNAEFFTAHADCNVASETPVFIIGMPRSGTSLTEQIISSHPEVIGAGEVIFWGQAPSTLPSRLGSSMPYPDCIHDITPAPAHDVAEIYLQTLSKIAGANSKPIRITDKLPHNFVQLGLIALLFPKAKIIHTRRDAMDTCLSIFFQNFGGSHPYAYDLSNLGHHHRQYERLMSHWHSVLPGRIMDVQYEDTIADPEFWSRKLIAHVGLEWDDACLAPHKLERTVKTASHWQVRQPIYKTSVARWKHYEAFLDPLKKSLGLT